MIDRWPSKDKLQKLQEDENIWAAVQGDIPDPICECGMPAYACVCEQLAKKLGYWASGEEYHED